MKYYLTCLILLLSLSTYAIKLQDAGRCIQVTIDAEKTKISLKKLETAIIKFKLTNCSVSRNFFIDKNAMTDYESPAAMLYFKVYRCEQNCVPYEYKKVSVQKVSNNVEYEIAPGFSYTYAFHLFELYKIAEPGYYRIVGYYRPEPGGTDSAQGDYIATSNELEILITP